MKKLAQAYTKGLVIGAVLLTAFLSANNIAIADNDKKMTICHASGQAGTTKFETLNIPENAVYGKNGESGHFNENGTTKAGHEQDYLGECKNASASTSPSANPSVNPSPSAGSSANPTPSSSATPAPSNNNNDNNSNNNNNSNNSGSNNSSSTSSDSQGQVLGATLADTGVVEDVIMNALGSVGGLMTTFGAVLYGKKKRS